MTEMYPVIISASLAFSVLRSNGSLATVSKQPFIGAATLKEVSWNLEFLESIENISESLQKFKILKVLEIHK